MAESTIGPRIAVTGEKEFKAAMASINNEFKMLGSEMKLAVSQFDKNDKSTQALTAQNKVLGKQVDAQKGKIALLTTQYDKQNSALVTLKTKLDATKAAFGADSAEVAKAQKEYDKQTRTVITLQTQLNNATTGLNDMNRQLESNNQAITDNSKNMGAFGEKMKEMGKTVAIGAAAIGTAFLGAIVAGVKMSDDLTKALNGLQASTGVADEQMAGMKDTMLAIYNDNFGENFEDIGKSIAIISQQSGLSGEALKVMTEDALTLRDTFEMDVGDSFKAAKMLMDQFGLSGKEAYGLIAQGAQWGMDKNGDLLDSINEYSVQFKTMGFSAEEFFNMLNNGAVAGGFSIDVMGDAVKEFNIRSKDGSKATSDAFKALGLDAGKLSKDFGAGGEKGKLAFETVSKALAGVKDPLVQNQVGTALWGTMWEDLGAKSILALGNTEGEINKTVDALGKINEVKYNSFGEAMEGIKRQLLTGIILPLGEEVLPKLNEFGNYLKTNMPQIIEQIKPVINGLLDSFKFLAENFRTTIPLIAGFAAGFAAFQIIGVVTGLVKAFRLATEAATIAQWALNVAMDANIIGAIVLAITALVTAGVALWMNWDTVKAKAVELWGKIQEAINPEAIKKKLDDVKVAITTKLGEWKTAIITWFTDVKTNIPIKLDEWGVAIGKWFTDTKTNISIKLGEWWIAIEEWFKSIPAKITLQLIEWKIALVKWATEQNEENKRQFGEWGKAIELWFGSIPATITLKLAEWKIAIITWFTNTKTDIITKLGEWWIAIGKWYDDTKASISIKLSEWWISMGQWFTDTKANIPIKLGEWWAGMGKWYDDTKAKIKLKLNEWWTDMGKWYDDTKANIMLKLSEWWAGMGKWFNDTGKNSIQKLTDGTNEKKQSFMDNLGKIIVDGLTGALAFAGIVIVATARELIKRFIESVKTMSGDVKSAFVFVVNNGIGYLKSLPGQALQWGKDMIQGFINGFQSIYIPKPHFNIKGSFDLATMSTPYLDVNWYDKGAVFNSPSIIGVGEKRPEFVGALDDLKYIVRSEIERASGGGVQSGGDINITMPGMVIREEADIEKISEALAFKARQNGMATGRVDW